MECKVVRYWISLYIDNELENETENELFKHIDECKDCNTYFQQSLDVNEEIENVFRSVECNSERIKANILSNIKSKDKKNNRKIKYSKLAICAAILVGIIISVPINGKTVIAHVSDWAKSFTIRKPGLIIKVEDIDNERTIHSGNKILVDIETEENFYFSIKDLNEKVYMVEKKTCLPPYFPEGYSFKYAKSERTLDSDLGSFDITTYFERDNKEINAKEYLNIKIKYKDRTTISQSFKYFTNINKEAKAIKIYGEDAVIIKERSGDGYKIYELHCIMNAHSSKIEIEYKSYKENSVAEEEIMKVASELVKQMKKEVPEKSMKDIKYRDISEIIEGDNEKEFYDDIHSLDDRIVKIESIPDGYRFDKGIFVNNPKEKFNIPSDYNSSYIKEDSKINIGINYYNYTDVGADFFSYQIGEIEKREPFVGYEIKLYKERESLESLIRAISITLPDYSMTININTKGSEVDVLEIEDMKNIAADIIEKVKHTATKTEKVRRDVFRKTYDSVKHLKESSQIINNGFVIPTYKPKGYEFARANYKNDPNRYLLQFVEKRKASDSEKEFLSRISIFERVGDITSVMDSMYVNNIEEAILFGYKGYIVKEKYKSFDSIKLQIEATQKNHLIEIQISHHGNDEGLKEELVKIAESMLKQLN